MLGSAILNPLTYGIKWECWPSKIDVANCYGVGTAIVVNAQQVGNAQHKGPNAKWKQNKILLQHTRQQTDLYAVLPYTESTRQST